MKKILFIVVLIVICKNTANAQIKIVDDDYAATMTGSKEYYDHDVDFDRIFSRGEKNGCLYPYLSQESYFSDYAGFIPNMLGDTIYFFNAFSEKPQSKGRSLSECFIYIFNGDTRVQNAPAGYYTIDGYIFCVDNDALIKLMMDLDLYFFDFNERTIQSLKEEILRKQDDFSETDLSKYQVCCVLKSITDSICVFAHIFIRDEFDACLLKFYNEATKFIGKEVVLTSGYGHHMTWNAKYFYTAPFQSMYNKELNVVCDGLTQNLVRLEDTKYKVTDIVLKDGVFYAVFTGTKTGTFSMEIYRILYAYSAEDIDEAPFELPGNNNGDVACMEFRCPGPKGTGAHDDPECNGIIYVLPSDQMGVLERRSKMAKAQQEQELKNKEIQYDREREKQKAAFINKMVAKYGDTFGHIIGKKQVSIGMTEEMCRDALGKPINTYRTTTRYGQSEVWCYNYKTRIYFFEGKVVQIDD